MRERDTKPDAVEIAKRWYNFHPDSWFSSVFVVISHAAQVMEPEAFAVSTAKLMEVLDREYYVRGRTH